MTTRGAGATVLAGALARGATISPLARAMFSRLPKRPMWLVPTLVIAATRGRAAAARRSISWGWFMPISTTRTCASSGASSRVMGTPMRLLKLPAVAWVRQVVPSEAASMSLVVVLPTEPVTPTTHQSWRSRHQPARRSMNSVASSASQRTMAQAWAEATSRAAASGSRVTATTPAPASMAAAT